MSGLTDNGLSVGERDFDQPAITRVFQVLTYLRLPILQETVTLLLGAKQMDVSRDLRKRLPLICQLLPDLEVKPKSWNWCSWLMGEC